MGYDVRDFEMEVIDASHQAPVVVDFWAGWCAPCRILGPTLEKLAEESGGSWTLAKVDTEAFPEEAARYGVRSIPNVKLFVDGEPVSEFVGALPEAQVRRWLERALPSEAEREARGALERARDLVFSDPEAAVALLEGVDSPADALDQRQAVDVFADAFARLEDPGILTESQVGRRYLEALKALKDRRFDDALAGLIQVLRDDRELDDEGPQRLCAAIFQYLGTGHPVVRARRSEFAGALYP